MNERLAQRYFEDADPVGERILIQEILPGVLSWDPTSPGRWWASWPTKRCMAWRTIAAPGSTFRTNRAPSTPSSSTFEPPSTRSLQQAITAAIHGVDEDQAVSQVRTVDQIADQAMVGDHLSTTLMGVFAAVALLLATIGIYGLMSYSVAQRTHEIGVRATLGAPASSLLRLVLGRGLLLTFLGLVIRLAGALGLTRFMASILYGIGAQDLPTLTSVAIVLSVVAGTACYVPARRATRVDPMVAMRCE